MDLSVSDKKILWALSGNECAICKCKLVRKKDSGANVGQECHISSEKPNWPSKEFSRYEPNLTEDERNKSIYNAILLCANCHKVIDYPKSTQFTIEKLHRIKEEHEAEVDTAKKHPDDFKKEEERKEKVAQQIRLMQWKLPRKIEDAEYTGFADKFIVFDTSFVKDIDNLPLFKNSAFSYDYTDIKKAWNDFKNSVDKYSSEKLILYEVIKKYIIQKLNQDFDTESEINEGFYLSVYREIIVRAKGEISVYDYFYEPRPIQYGIETKYQLKYLQKAEPEKDGCVFSYQIFHIH